MSLVDDFVPFQIHNNTNPITVSWVESKSLVFNEPVFNQSIRRLRQSGANPKVVRSSLDELLDLAEIMDISRKIKGFVFHTSRCGSTMVVNAIRNCDSSYVISESQLFSSIMLPEDCGFWAKRNVDIDFRYKVFLSLEKIFLKFFMNRDSKANLFVKFSSWNIINLDWLMKYRAATPNLIIFRDPIETLVSLLRKPVGFYYMRDSPLLGALFADRTWPGQQNRWLHYCNRSKAAA
jgi:hypothetical protein